jgi:D-alanyl-D-alanine carboxypeptidase (penicillin-binding protein 5/6)
MYCLSASAERNGVEYIAVVMHGETSAGRFAAAASLLDYAFANYTTVSLRLPEALSPILVELGEADSVQPVYTGPEKRCSEKRPADFAV